MWHIAEITNSLKSKTIECGMKLERDGLSAVYDHEYGATEQSKLYILATFSVRSYK